MNLTDFPCKIVNDYLLLNIYVQPNSKVSSIEKFVEMENNELYLKVKISAPAEDQKANIEVVKYLSQEFGVSKSSVSLVKGQKSRQKLLKFEQNIDKIVQILQLYKPLVR